MPDQYTLAAFQRLVYGKAHAPLMAEVTLTSSHTPWAPVPQLVDWKAIGDGAAVYGTSSAQRQLAGVGLEGSAPAFGPSTRGPSRIRSDSLISWVRTYGKDNLVLVFLGDHQADPSSGARTPRTTCRSPSWPGTRPC